MGVVDEDVVDVVLEDCRLAGGRRELVARFGGGEVGCRELTRLWESSLG